MVRHSLARFIVHKNEANNGFPCSPMHIALIKWSGPMSSPSLRMSVPTLLNARVEASSTQLGIELEHVGVHG